MEHNPDNSCHSDNSVTDFSAYPALINLFLCPEKAQQIGAGNGSKHRA
jgi:hypothetical protein